MCASDIVPVCCLWRFMPTECIHTTPQHQRSPNPFDHDDDDDSDGGSSVSSGDEATTPAQQQQQQRPPSLAPARRPPLPTRGLGGEMEVGIVYGYAFVDLILGGGYC